MAEITIDKTACVRCGACVDVCAIAGVFELKDDGAHVVHPERCWGCGHCVAVCPTDAIDHEDFPLEEAPIIDQEILPSLESLETAFRSRRSCRMFKEEPVPRDLVRLLVSIGRWGPTAHNSQAVDWLGIDDRLRIAELAKITIDRLVRYARLVGNPLLRPLLSLAFGKGNVRTLKDYRRTAFSLSKRWGEGKDPIFYRAPVVLIAHTPSGNPFGCDDAAYAAYHVILAAERLGLGTCQIGFVQGLANRDRKIKRAIPVPASRKVQVVLALGYPKHNFRRMLPRRDPNLVWNPR